MHLVQLNIGKPLGPMDGPVMRGFKAGLDLVNGIAERSPALSGGSRTKPTMQHRSALLTIPTC